jgi:predicted ABC-type ATPase
MELFIIAGPNGVGKTTFAREFLPHFADCKNFVNADLIAQGVAPFSPEGAAFRAGRMMLNEIQSFSKRRDPFAFETTLSGRSYISLIRRLKRKGYKVYLFFLCVENVEVALSRIRQRVMKGGHDVPELVVRRRFDRSLDNFFREYQPIVDSWHLFDNTGSTPVTIAFKTGAKPRIIDRDKYRKLIRRYGSERTNS